MKTITIPDWCYIGKQVKIKYPRYITGSDGYYRETIVGYTDSGFLSQDKSSGCPMYEHKFTEYGKTVVEV